jgi:octanoyl-[GcvH]:protein N-octanoyltransferase
LERIERNVLKLPEEMILVDRTDSLQPDVLYSFAVDELWCHRTGAGGAAVLHLWRHPQALVMGLRDSRLPHARKAAEALVRSGCSVAVRNSGGAAVPLDPGVINISIILPKAQGAIHFHDDFETMYRLIDAALALSVLGASSSKGEVIGSYCPGDYDLSVAGRKFSGLAQRRQLHALIVQAFVVVEGTGAKRADMAKAFYELAAAGASVETYPQVDADTMASLTELVGPVSVTTFRESILKALKENGTSVRPAEPGEQPEEAEIERMAGSLKDRYAIGNR